MKTLDVAAWKLSIEQAQKDIKVQKVQFKTVQDAVKKIISLEGIFSGKNADAIRLFYSTCHQPLLTYTDEMFIHYEETLKEMQDAIHSYESVPKGFVQQHFIEGDVTTDLNNLTKVSEGITKQANTSISDVSDIVQLPLLSCKELIEKVDEAKDMSKQTVEQLMELDRSQADALVVVNENVKTLLQFLEDVRGLLHTGDMSVMDINLTKLLSSKAFTEIMWKTNPLHKAYTKFIDILSVLTPIALYLNPANVLPALMRWSDDLNINDVMESEQYKQLAAENQMTTEEEAALAHWLENPDEYTYTSDTVEGVARESVPAREPPPTHEQRREVMGGNASGTIDGLGGPFAAAAHLVYYLTIDDAVVLLDPNSTPDERLVAGFFLIPTPGKFAKPFMKYADDAGGAMNAARKTGKVVNINNKKVIETATSPRKGGETLVGHALQKHAGRNPHIWGKVKGGPEKINNSALSHLEDILDAPGNFIEVTTSKGIKFLEKTLPDGRGVRLELNGNFKGFID